MEKHLIPTRNRIKGIRNAGGEANALSLQYLLKSSLTKNYRGFRKKLFNISIQTKFQSVFRILKNVWILSNTVESTLIYP